MHTQRRDEPPHTDGLVSPAHAAHHIQGIELHLGRPIIYSPGAAVDDYALDGHFRNDLGLLVALDLAQPPAPFQTPPELFPLGPVGKWRGGESAGGDEREAGVEGRSDGSEEDERGEEGRGRGAVVTRLRVVGTHIEHDWGAAGGYPPYELRADVAEGRNRDWVLGRVQELSEEMGTR